MRARRICSWCLAEGRTIDEATLGWAETSDGSPTHGMCQEHFAKMLAEVEGSQTACEHEWMLQERVYSVGSVGFQIWVCKLCGAEKYEELFR